MPIYQYKCNRCDNQFEKRQSVNAKPIKVCPKCGSWVVRLISKSNFIIKGGGTKTKKYRSGLE